MPRSLPILLLLALGARAAGPARAEDTPAPRIAPAVAAIEPWLKHEDWTVRSLAAFELGRRAEEGATLLATRLLAVEKDPLVISPALGALQPRARAELVAEGGAPLVEILLRLANHPNRRVRTRARDVLSRIPPVPLGGSLDAYEGWWKKGKDALEREREEILRRPAVLGTRAPLAPGETASVAPDSTPYEYLGQLHRDGLEVCVVLDNTGSMIPVIAAAKAQAVALLRKLSLLVPRVRAGLVTYDDGATVRIGLTSDENALVKAFRKVAASGGGDIEEGVDKGIRTALKQERMGWSRGGWRVLVVIGDAPPHEEDVAGMLATIRKAREDDLYDHPVVIHTVSTDLGGVEHFAQIAKAGGGQAVTLHDVSRLVEELVALTFGAGFQDRVRPWLEEIAKVRAEDAP